MKKILKNKNIIIEMFRWSIFKDIVKIIPENQKAKKRQWDNKKIEKTQEQKIEKLISHATKNSKYYRSVSNKIDVFSDFEKTNNKFIDLPTLTKKKIVAHFDDIWIPEVMEKTGQKAYVSKSSGTSNAPVTIYHLENGGYVPNAACVNRSYDAWNIGKWKNIIWVTPEIESSFLGYHFGWNFFHMYSPAEIAEDPSVFERLDPGVIIGDPVLLRSVSKILSLFKKQLKIEKILTTYDILDNSTREEIKGNLGSELSIYEYYSMSEISAPIAWECESGMGMHINSDYIVVEILEVDKDSKVKDGEIGEVVVTDLSNFLMPIIRYRTGDLAYSVDQKCSCGRQLPLMSRIQGRISSTYDSNDGRITLTDLFAAVYPFGSGEIEVILHKRTQECEVKILKKEDKRYPSIENLNLVVKKLFPKFEINIRVVKNIIPTKTWKYKTLIIIND